ncbi:MAG: MerR family transcriptional regulator [Bacteroidales bacterium]
MSTYFIKDLEKLSGIKAHTIRIWEKRYEIVKPKRTETNIRYYSDEDLKRLLNVSILNRNGMKISRIADMSSSEIEHQMLNLSNLENDYQNYIEKLILAMIDLDENHFERILSHLVTHIGFQETLIKIIHPFFNKIGVLWLTGSVNPAQEHFVTNLIRQKLIVAIDGLTVHPRTNSKRFMMFLPENEWHELGLLFYHYLIKSYGHQVIYLGQSVPHADVVKVANIKRPDYIFTLVTAPMSEDNFQAFLREVSSCFPKQNIFVGGLQIREFNKSTPANVTKVTSGDQLLDILSDIV